VHNGVLFDISNLRHLSDPLDDGVVLEVTVVYLANANGFVGEKRIFFMSGLEEIEMIVQGGGVEVVLQHDDV
jgi:hypothetical protein